MEKLVQIPGMTSITYSINKENTNVIMGREIKEVWGQGYITDYIGDVKYQISPLSFFQVNPAQTETLYGLALEYADLKGEETVWDEKVIYEGRGDMTLDATPFLVSPLFVGLLLLVVISFVTIRSLIKPPYIDVRRCRLMF